MLQTAKKPNAFLFLDPHPHHKVIIIFKCYTLFLVDCEQLGADITLSEQMLQCSLACRESVSRVQTWCCSYSLQKSFFA